MSGERKIIRDSVVAALAASLEIPVFASRILDGRDESEFINVFIPQGDAEYSGIQLQNQSSMVVAYRTTDQLDDDQLDEKGDEIIEVIQPHGIAPEVVHGIIYVGYEYVDDASRGFSGIEIKYTVHY